MIHCETGVTHLRYHRWATGQVLEESIAQPAELLVKDFKVSFGSIYGTLVHLYQADAIWLDRLHNRPTGSLADYPAPGCTFELRDAWFALQDQMIDFAGGLTQEGWDREISYKTLAGISYQTPIWQMILHIVNHGTHHRGQITSMLRQLGIKPLNLDLIGFYRSNPTTTIHSTGAPAASRP
jgi:uncharacterized damage-inducible protein DinB